METPAAPARGRPGSRRSTAQPPPAARPEPLVPAAVSSYALEVHCLGILLRRPGLLYQVDRRLQEEGLVRLSAEDFEHADHQAIMRLFQASVDQDLAEPLNYVFNFLDLPMMELADDLLARTEELDPNEERVLEDLMRGLLDLRSRKLHQQIEYLRYLFVEAQQEGDIQATQNSQTMVKLAQVKQMIDRAIKKYTSRSYSARQ